MKKFLQRTCSWLVMLIAMFAVSMSASAQFDLLGSGTKVFSATGTLDGTYTTTYQDAQSTGMPFAQGSTAALDVVNSAKTKVATASVSLSGYDVTFTVSGSTATTDGAYTIVVPENYFYSGYSWMPYYSSEEKFTINLTGMGGGTVDPGTGGGTVDPGTGGGEVDPVDPTPSGQPLNVTFDFSKGFVAEKDGITCESDGMSNSVYGWQLKTDKHITFSAPYGYLISQIVVKDGSGYNNNYYTEIDGGDWSAGNTWTGSASSVTLTSYYNSRLTTATITLVKDPNAKELFAFTGATPAAGTELESLETFTLGLPADVTSLTDFGSTISVNGNSTSVSASVNGTGLVITLDKAIVTDGSYTIVVPQEFATAGSGAINSEYTVQYTVNSPVFELTADNFSPKPGDDIELDLANGQVFKAVNVIYPAGITLSEGTVPFRIDGTKVSGTFTAYDGRGLLNFEKNSITTSGSHTFEFLAGAFTSTTGKKSTAFTLTYEVGVKHNKYTVNLNAGTDAMPADATITVAGADYKSGDVISVTTVLAESDITNTDVDGFIFKSVEITQPQTVEINNNKVDIEGAVIVTYEKIIPRVEYTEITPAAEIDLDNNGRLSSICIKFPENFSTDYTVAPTGFSFTDPAGQQITLSTPYGFTGWSSGTDLYINFPVQEALGTYTLDIPADAITFASGLKNEAIHFEWTLRAEYFQFPYTYSDVVKEFASFTLKAPAGTTFNGCTLNNLKLFEGYSSDDEPIYEEIPVTVDISSNPTEAVVTFVKPVVEKGSYNYVIPEGCFTTADGRKNREYNFYQNVDPTEYIDILSTTPENYVTVDGPFTSIVLNLGSELDRGDVIFGETISFNWSTDLPVTATLNGKKVTLTFDDSCINYGSNNNTFLIPEGFITTIDGAISRSVGIYNVWINAPKLPLELSGIQMGWDGDVVTTSGAKVEQVGVLLVQFPENVALAEDADLNAITVTDGTGSPCQLYMSGDAPYIYVTNGNQLFVWVNPSMTKIGTYTLHIPAGYLVGEDSGNVNAEINFELVIADIETFEPATSIADDDTVDTLTELVLTAPAGVTFSHFTDYPANFFYLTGEGITGDGKVYMQATVAEDGKTATLKLGNIKKNGEYTITVPKGYLRSTTPNTGNAEIVIRVTVDHKVLDWDANDNGIVEVNDVDAAVSAALERAYYGMGSSSDDDPALKALDLNEDGEITIGEITKLIEQLQPAK